VNISYNSQKLTPQSTIEEQFAHAIHKLKRKADKIAKLTPTQKNLDCVRTIHNQLKKLQAQSAPVSYKKRKIDYQAASPQLPSFKNLERAASKLEPIEPFPSALSNQVLPPIKFLMSDNYPAFETHPEVIVEKLTVPNMPQVDFSALKIVRSIDVNKIIKNILILKKETLQFLSLSFRKSCLDTWNLADAESVSKNSLLSEKIIIGMATNDQFSAIIYKDHSIVEIRKKEIQDESWDFSTPLHVLDLLKEDIPLDNTNAISLCGNILAVALNNGQVVIFDLEQMKCTKILRMHSKPIVKLHLTADYVLTSADRSTQYYKLKNEYAGPFSIQRFSTTACAVFIANTWAYLGDRFGNIRIWDLAENKQIYESKISITPIVAFLANQNGFLVAAENSLIHFQNPNFNQKVICEDFERPITTLTQFDNHIVVGTEGGKIFEFSSNL